MDSRRLQTAQGAAVLAPCQQFRPRNLLNMASAATITNDLEEVEDLSEGAYVLTRTVNGARCLNGAQ